MTPLPRINYNDKPAVILRFVNRKHKVALLKRTRCLKEHIYINTPLTNTNADITKKGKAHPEHMDDLDFKNIH